MRVYLVVIDESPESQTALRFAARRAARTGGEVTILSLVPPAEFIAFGALQATIEDEALDRAERLVAAAAGTIIAESTLKPRIIVQTGDGPTAIRELIAADPAVAALVLGAAAGGEAGPLVEYFTSAAGSLPVPLVIVPGGLTADALERLS